MKKTLTLLCLLVITSIAGAQPLPSLTPMVREIINNSNTQRAKALRPLGTTDATTTANRSSATRHLIFATGSDATLLPYSIVKRGDVHIISVTADELAQLATDSTVTRLEVNRSRHRLLLDNTVPIVAADKAWEGIDNNLPQAFDGDGVVVGVIDVSQEYVHPTLRSTTDGHLRVVRAWDMTDNSMRQQIDTLGLFPLGRLHTDTLTMIQQQGSVDCYIDMHGTHTTGIAAGSGWYTPYRGLAPESDIYLATTVLSTNIEVVPEEWVDYNPTTPLDVLALNNIFAYADSVGKPCVVNYSIGGTQDITNSDALYEAFYSELVGPGHIFVAAAGNSGDYVHTYMQLDDATSTAGGLLTSDEEMAAINIRATSALTLVVANSNAMDTKQLRIPLNFSLEGERLTSDTTLIWQDFAYFCDSLTMPNILVSVYSDVATMTAPATGYDIYLYTTDSTKISDNSLAVWVERADDSSDLAEIYVQEATIEPLTDSNGETILAGAQEGGSMNSPGALPSVIAVGATAEINGYTDVSGKWHSVNYCTTPGDIATFSSRGPTIRNTIKPDVVAPGVCVASSYNKSFTDDYMPDYTVGYATYDGEEYPFARISGTSMATPVVTGIIALWLQACPTLSPDDIRELFAATCDTFEGTSEYPNNTYGYGRINAYRGLLHLYNLDGISAISQRHASGVTVRPSADGGVSLTFDAPTSGRVAVRVYSTTGQLLHTQTLPHSTTSASVSLNHSGIACVQVDGYGSTLVRMK